MAYMASYYNEVDKFAAAWLRELIREGLIADGKVDERSIADVQADDLRGFTQCHFFAGIGGWSYALRLAGWPDDQPVWTGSCPCQPFSQAGKGRGKEDARHLWPQFRRLIRQCRPAIIFGEQVASAAGRVWLSGVCADLEALAYRAAGADLCAASVGAWHIRQRLYWVADSGRSRRRARRAGEARSGGDETQLESSGLRNASGMADTDGWHPLDEGLQRGGIDRLRAESRCRDGQAIGSQRANPERMGDSKSYGHQGRHLRGDGNQTDRIAKAGAWRDVEWLTCADGKQRPTQPGIFPLAHGVSGRVGQLRGYGNAIVPSLAAEFIKAYKGGR